MNVYEMQKREPKQLHQLVSVWKDSVRTTHLFLSDAEIEKIQTYVPSALHDVGHLIVAEKKSGQPIAFMGITGNRLEMLFLSSTERGNGLGRQLLEYGIHHYDIREVTVNEQIPPPAGFSHRLEFAMCKTHRRGKSLPASLHAPRLTRPPPPPLPAREKYFPYFSRMDLMFSTFHSILRCVAKKKKEERQNGYQTMDLCV